MFRDDENEEIRQFAAKTVPVQVEKKSEKLTKPKEELKTEKPQKNEKIVENSEVKTQPSKTRKMDGEKPKSQVLKPKDPETTKNEAPKVPKPDLDEKKVEKIVNKPIEKLKRELPKEKSSKPSRSQTDNFEKRAKLPGTSKEIKKTPSTVEPVVSVPIPKLEKANTLKEHPDERIKLGFVNMNGFENGNLDKDLNQNDLRGRKATPTALKPLAKETKASEQLQEPRKLADKVEASTKPPLPKSTPPKITSPKAAKNTYITKIIVGLDSDDDDIIVSKPKASPKQLPTTLVENKMPNNAGGTSHVK
uniref:Uncharacterized protein n=1 Tax=Panagrolaimus sp. JU765 TaxID=591449 RepID=A0AC34QEF7_9BILA